jgi:hypothetical protein
MEGSNWERNVKLLNAEFRMEERVPHIGVMIWVRIQIQPEFRFP